MISVSVDSGKKNDEEAEKIEQNENIDRCNR